MQDEIYDRYYQAGRHEHNAGLESGIVALGHGLAAFGRGLAAAFRTLNAIPFAAPWRKGDCDKTGLA